MHLYIGLRIGGALPGLWAVALGALLAASALLMPLALVARRIARPPLADTLTWAGMLFMGLFSSLLVFTLIRDAALLLAWLAQLPVESFRTQTAVASGWASRC